VGRRNVYLGKRVPDVGKKGLDSLVEVEGIVEAILEDAELGRIPKKKAVKRMSLMKLVVMRDSDFKGAKRRKAIQIVDEGREKLKGASKGKRKR